MSNGTKNLTVARSEKSVWDSPGLAGVLAGCDQERWMTGIWGAALATFGSRRGGFAGGLLAVAGLTLTARAAMGRRDFSRARDWVDRSLQENGWRQTDIVNESSDDSFPASDSPSWTSTAGARN